ncbi:hypothetical protein Mapa_014331 [Marchantia paleacea]|nr:hypothetical protein Mapa_014331 [Marchantia paleacea]
MQPGDVLLVCLLSTSIFGFNLVNGDEGSDFLDYKEEQARRIAESAIANYDKKCELVATCSESCTRGGCSPRLDDFLQCTSILENKRCSDTPCNNILVNFNRSYVRYPRYDYTSSSVESVSSEMRDSICSQRMLDPLFLNLLEEQRKKNEKNSEDYYFNFYFGSVDGTFRFYPGLVQDCYGYDPRIRPWYNGAISVKKDIVVLLDTGASMNDIQGYTIAITSVEIAEILAKDLLKTLTANDRATVIGFDSTQASNILSQIDVQGTGLNISDSKFQDQLLRINETRATPPSGPSNYTAGLMEAVSTFRENSSDALKIIVLFTDGKSTVSSEAQLATVLEEFTKKSIRLFIYEISDKPGRLNTTACILQGYHQNLDPINVVQNPLYSLESYFTFLADSHVQSEGSTKAFWQKVYVDYGTLGDIITVAYPAMSSDGHLIGVAGIDIQTNGLDAILKKSIEGSLGDRRNQISVNNKGVNFENCTAVIKGGNDSCEIRVSDPICVQDDTRSSYKDLICCGECALDENGDSQSVVISVVVSLFSLLALAGGGLFLYFRFCRPRGKQPSLVDIVKVPKFSYETLSLATNRFSESNQLGHGTYGVVYIGTLETGLRVAVKKLHFKPDHDFKDFEAEIRVLATANHNNLVALQGFCVDQHYVLVYELVENGDLDDWLFEKPLKSGKVLPWAQRVTIARGTARGLAYLHEELQNQQKVCHSDIKPANILLDKDFNPKVADFGMAKLYDGGTDLYAIGGTLGYMAPEVLNGAIASTKTDVYSYGIVLLEMVTGRRFSEFKTQNFRHWANTKVAEGQERDLVDPNLKGLEEADHAMAKTLLGIALRCTTIDPDSRPDMSAVVKMIEGYLPVPPLILNEQPDKVGLSSESTSQTGESFRWEGSWTMSQAIYTFQGKGKGGKPLG